GREALEIALEQGITEYEALVRIDLGRLGVDAEQNLLTGHRIAQSVNAVAVVEAAESAMRRQGVRVPSRRRGDPLALTDAEQRVAQLVSEGLSNRAIADRLSYSVKTIEAYLSRVYAKTGCANRVELSRLMAATGS